jgi:hypothetical protein
MLSMGVTTTLEITLPTEPSTEETPSPVLTALGSTTTPTTPTKCCTSLLDRIGSAMFQYVIGEFFFLLTFSCFSLHISLHIFFMLFLLSIRMRSTIITLI